MKTRLVIEIETPDNFELMYEEGEEVSEEDTKRFAKEWHDDLISHIKKIKGYLEKEYNSELDEYYNEDGELPEFKIIVK